MFVVQMLNSAGEWELCRYVFSTAEEAHNFYAQNLSMFEDYAVEELTAY
jgi:hypothetical protein